MLIHTLPYTVLLFNTLLFEIARKVTRRVCPSDKHPKLSTLLKEVIATLELCADCAELSVVWEVHGNLGYGAALFVLGIWWSLSWEDAEACPCTPLEDCFLCGVPITSLSIIAKILGQSIGAYFTWKYANLFWSLHLIPPHEALHTGVCQAGLQVSMLFGAVVEAIITFISRIIALESSFWTPMASAVINSLTTVSLCILALDSSGGFFNPILASALTLNCQGNNLVQHIFVYWLGSLAGGIVARTIHMVLRGETPAEYRKLHEE